MALYLCTYSIRESLYPLILQPCFSGLRADMQEHTKFVKPCQLSIIPFTEQRRNANKYEDLFRFTFQVLPIVFTDCIYLLYSHSEAFIFSLDLLNNLPLRFMRKM